MVEQQEAKQIELQRQLLMSESKEV